MRYSCSGVRRSLLGLMAPVALGAALVLTPAIAHAGELPVSNAVEELSAPSATDEAGNKVVAGPSTATNGNTAAPAASEAIEGPEVPSDGGPGTAAPTDPAASQAGQATPGSDSKATDAKEAAPAEPGVIADEGPSSGSSAAADNPSAPEAAEEKAIPPAAATDGPADKGTPLATGTAPVKAAAVSSDKAASPAAGTDPAKAVAPSGKGASPAKVAKAEDAGKAGASEPAKPAISYVNMYRLYNPNSGEHFYTSSLSEASNLFSIGWRWEGVGWVAPETSKAPVYRLYNKNGGDHHYTTSGSERDQLVKLGWRYEGIGWYSDLDADSKSVWRQYNPNARSGAHNFTVSTRERDLLVKAGWNDEKIAWNASNQETRKIQGFWKISSAWGSLERYWVGSDANIARSRIVTPEEGAGYYAYARSDGRILRGKAKVGSQVLLSNNDGRLTTQTSWLITKAYDGGDQRYYLAKDKGAGYSYAKTGFFQAALEGTKALLWFFGHPSQGYMVRGAYSTDKGMLVSDYATGALAENYEKPGMVVSKRYNGDLQRYYLYKANNNHLYARVGKFRVGSSDYYGREDGGYLVRGYYINPKGKIFYGDNEGRLSKVPLSAAGMRAWRRIANYASATRYILVVDSDACKTFVFEGSAGRWVPKFEWLAGVGKTIYNNGNGTPKSEHYTLGGDNASYNSSGNGEWRRYYYEKDGLYYFSGFVLDCGFHSTLFDGTSPESQVGRRISHGCVRLLTANAKWIYDNCQFGTRVVSY